MSSGVGQVKVDLKIPWRGDTTHRIMSPLEFMQPLAALTPRTRLHLICFHGARAASAKLQALVVPHEPAHAAQHAEATAARAA